MIVERGHVGLIISGRRTQTRTLVDQREPGYRVRTGRRGQSHSLSKPWVPKVGDRLPIQARELVDGRMQTVTKFYVVVTEKPRQEPAGATTRADAEACGYSTLTAWKAAWVREHGKNWVARERDRQAVRAAAAAVGVELDEAYLRRAVAERGADALVAMMQGAHPDDLAQALEIDAGRGARRRGPDAPPVLPTLTAAYLAARFDGFHADHLVWVIDHAVATDEPYNLLARSPGSAQTDYVSSPAQALGGDLDPGEAVDRETIARLGHQAALREQQGVTRDWLDLRASIEQRIARIKDAHALAPGDMKYLRNLERVLDSGDRRFGEVA